MFSLASMATMAACIFLFGIFYSIGVNFEGMVKEAEEGVAVTVFFNEGITEDQITAIGDQIASRPEVASYNYVSADEAWEEYKDVYFQGNEDAASSFVGDNPLAGHENYEIYLSDVSQQDELVTFLEGLDGVREVKHSEVTANTLSDFNKLLTLISGFVVAILIAVAVFLISNTVTVGISIRKEEIAIMKLIGALKSSTIPPKMEPKRFLIASHAPFQSPVKTFLIKLITEERAP
jgi:cell division transport system permease protein